MRILNPSNLYRQVLSPQSSIFTAISYHHHGKFPPIKSLRLVTSPFPSTYLSTDPQNPVAPLRFYCAHSSSSVPFLKTSPLGFHPPLPFPFPFPFPFFSSPLHSCNGLNLFKSDPDDAALFRWHKPSRPIDGVNSSYLGKGQGEITAVLLGWLGARPKNLRRYAELYTSKGINAITFVVPVRDLMWFDLGRKVENRIKRLADEIVSWLLETEKDGRERQLVFHTFSNTGWLVYGAILRHLQDRPDLIEKIRGCIVDSGAEPKLNPKVWAAGFSAAVLKKRNSSGNPLEAEELNSDSMVPKIQEKDPLIVEAMLLLFLEKLFSVIFKLPDVTLRLSQIISHLRENQPHHAPQLYLYSTADKIIPAGSVESFAEHQRQTGRIVGSFNFETSPHVDHYRTYPGLYSSKIHSFLNECFEAEKRL